jgi:hypothetical protein
VTSIVEARTVSCLIPRVKQYGIWSVSLKEARSQTCWRFPSIWIRSWNGNPDSATGCGNWQFFTSAGKTDGEERQNAISIADREIGRCPGDVNVMKEKLNVLSEARTASGWNGMGHRESLFGDDSSD